jgi:toxin ParE1/3/4
MAEVFVSSAAQADLDAIDLYSLIEFGPVVADRYHGELLRAFDLIGKTPKVAPIFRKGKPPVRSWPCGKHRIYYVINREHIRVIRVLHMAMDQDRAMRAMVRKA